MAYHPNSAPQDLRTLDVAQASAIGQTHDGFILSTVHTAVNPRLAPVLNPQKVPNPGFGGGTVYPNAAHGGAEWIPSAPAPHGYVSVNPSAAIGYPAIGSNIGANGIDKSGNEVAPGFGHGPYVGHRIMGDTMGHARAQNENLNGSGQNFVTMDRRNDEEQFGSDSGVSRQLHLSDRGSGSGAAQLRNKVEEGLVLGRTVKLLCKFGGELSFSTDRGVLRYTSGETKIVSVRRDVSYKEFVQKMEDTCGQPVVVKYQLPDLDQDLDALISVTNPEDLDYMMNEYERLDRGSSDGSAKLKVFLFPKSKLDSSSAIRHGDLHGTGQRNVEVMNGMMDGVGGGTARKESTASTTSSQNSDTSSYGAVDRIVPVQADINGPPLTSTPSSGRNLATSNDASSLQFEIEQERTVPKRLSANDLQQAGGGIPSASPHIWRYMDPRKEDVNMDYLPPPHMTGSPSPHQLGTTAPAYGQQQFPVNAGRGNSQQLVSAVDRTMGTASSQASLRPTVVLPFTHPQQNHLGHEATSGKRLIPLPLEKHHDAYQGQAPSAMVGGTNGSHVHQLGQAVYSDGSTFCWQAENIQRFEEHALCQKALPDAFSKFVVLDQGDTTVSHQHASSPIHHCLPLEDNIKSVLGMNDPDSTKHMVGFAGNGQSPSGVFQGVVPEPSLEISMQQHFMPAQCQLRQEASASKLVTGDSCPVGGSAEHIIEQEPQNVPEGVVTCAFQTALPSNPDLTVYEGSKPSHEVNQEKDVHHKADSEDASATLAGRVHFHFPVDAIGGLQMIKRSDLEVRQELGSGTFGTVHHGKWRGKDVAIKQINDKCFLGEPTEQERKMRDFLNEAKLLADLHHPNVVTFYGIVYDGPNGPGDSVATVTEYMVDGSLRKALQKGERNFDMRKRVLIAREVAFGMEYLHDKKIVHFDLKSDNLLVNLGDPRQPTCKIGDLGLSKVKRQTLISGGMRGTLPWMAPELLNDTGDRVSEKVDVYSFGIVMWELLTGEEPYADLDTTHMIGGIVNNTLRPQVPASCDPEWKSLMERCWSSEPSERPSFTEIAKELCSIALRTNAKSYNRR